ncbi:MAG: hypothetical protein DDT38_00509 [Firmicutes bacterium]|nr:hypothetical protein [candidate division NPL-UPA2 bacterium]
MELTSILAFLAVIVEQVVGIIKSAFPKVRNHYAALAAIVVGIALCVGTRVGVLSALNVPIAYRILDYVVSGLLISRGANLIHDLLQNFSRYTRNNSATKK